MAPPLLPAFDRFVGRFLPNGATVETVRNAVYFTDHQHLEPILVDSSGTSGFPLTPQPGVLRTAS